MSFNFVNVTLYEIYLLNNKIFPIYGRLKLNVQVTPELFSTLYSTFMFQPWSGLKLTI